MAKRAEQLALPATSGQNVAAATATAFTRPTRGVIATTAGVLTCRFVDDGADRTFQTIAGGYYPVSLTSVPVGNAVAFLALF